MLAVCPHDCPDTCSMVVTVEGDRAVSLRGNPDHPFTSGFLCHKVSRYLERVYHRDRLLHPLRRVGPKGSGRFERIAWDDALDEISQRFREIAAGPHGPQAILPYSYCGTMGRIQGESLDRRFFHRLGASLLARTICATAGGIGYRFTMGTGQGMDPDAFRDSRFIINWGSNTAVTNVHLWVKMHEARKEGAKIVTIDPYRSRTAEKSDWHLAPRVGTDAALALGLMHVIFRDRFADDDYLARFCIGAQPLRERVEREYGLDRVAQITGLPAADIERLAHEYATTKPAAIRLNYGLQRHHGGGMAVRTIACLPAVIGAWRRRAGGVLLSTSATFPLDFDALQRPDLVPPGTRTVNLVQLAEALHNALPGPPVLALYVYNSNPAAVAPDQSRVLSGLLRDDLFTVVHEQFPTDTVDYADIVLPATTQLEHFDLHTSYGHQWVQVNQPAIPPLGESRPNTGVFRALARRLGFEPELFELSDEDLARIALRDLSVGQASSLSFKGEHPTPGHFASEMTGWKPIARPRTLDGITLDSLKAGPQRLNVPTDLAPFAEGNFPTPSGKCELYSERMKAQGLDPLPCWIPPAESPESAPELAAKYPLQLISPPSPHFLNSTFANVESLRAAAREPEVWIHPDDAALRGVTEGSGIRVHNGRGAFLAKARVGENARRGVVVAPGIWWNKHTRDGVNANVTAPTTLTDMGGGATFFDCLVEVALAGED